MLIREFIPCIHLADIRYDFSENNDTLAETLESYQLNTQPADLSGEDEYCEIMRFRYSKKYNEFRENTLFQLLVEVMAGAFALSYPEKLIFLTQIITGKMDEQRAIELLDILIEERNSLFILFERKQKK